MRRLSCLAALAGALLAGCASSPCDRNAQVDLGKKAGTCEVPKDPALGTASSCTSAVGTCSAADQKALVALLDCLDALPVCAPATQDTWLGSRAACLERLGSLSTACRDAFATPGLQPQAPDAGLWAVTDGGEGLDFVAVADESAYAFAWTPRQAGAVQRWVLTRVDGQGTREDLEVGGPAIDRFLLPDAGAPGRWFLAGLDGQGALVWGQAATSPGADGGAAAQCVGILDCDPDHVCDLGRCVTQTCASGSTTCPGGYLCLTNHCVRIVSDGGVFDAGTAPGGQDAGAPERPLPFLSAEVALTRGPPAFGPTVSLGNFAGRHADVAALDSARVVAVLEQEGQLVAHLSHRRGADFADDAVTTSLVDTLGTRPKLAWNVESRALFACYTVGRGVRVRVSRDDGRTWGADAVTLEPDADAGLATSITDCDLAPWKDGGALLVTVDDDRLVLRSISPTLAVGAPDIAMRASPPSALNVTAPAHPAIATLPAEGLVHLTFTGARQLPSLVMDTEIYGVMKDGPQASWTGPMFLKPGFGAIQPGTSLPQDWSTVAIEPGTKRALAAYVSQEGGPTGGVVNTVYAALWNPALKTWGTGPDLSVFAIDTRDNVTTLLFPQKQKADPWDAFSPSLAVLPGGRLFLTFVAGPRPLAYGDYRAYAVGFDFDTVSPASNGKGWFVPPVRPLGTARVLSPSGVASAPPAPVSAAACDAQLSLVGVFAEGLGANGEVDGRVLFSASP